MSQSATIGRVLHGVLPAGEIDEAPPARSERRNVRRGSIPRGCDRGDHAPRHHVVVGQLELGDGALGPRDLLRSHLGEVLALQDLALGHGEPGGELLLVLLRLARPPRPVFSRASAARSAAASGFFVVLRVAAGERGERVAMIFSITPRRRQKMRKACSNTSECSCFFTKTAWSVQ